MGLDIFIVSEAEYCLRAGSYGGFGQFRRILAKSVGIDLDEMKGYGGTRAWNNWIPFVELLNHSDCDGELTYDERIALADDFNDDKIESNFINTVEKEVENVEYYLDNYKNWKEALSSIGKGCREIIFR